jgi:4-aminobutyrate aminotransferase/4-aminobutyrate aminotransferase/(S)-3-amino-2-methylpropionate transaminase
MTPEQGLRSEPEIAAAAPASDPISVAWASGFAAKAPDIRVPIPGPKSLALFERCRRVELGSFPWVDDMPIGFAGGAGVTLEDVDGNILLDLTHGHMSAGLGHGNPEIADAIDRQTRKLMNLRNYPTEIRVELMERLAGITPGDLNLFGFFSSGTEAAEGAMRVARAVTGGHEFLSFYGDYHGKTMGAIATSEIGNRTTGPRPSGFTIVPGGYCHRCEFKLEPSTCGLHCIGFAERAMKANSHGALAGVFAEPITNGSGARVYPPGYLKGLRDIADRNNVPLIFDEHATGFGRCGTMWAGDDEGVIPDIIFFSKMAGNGYPVTILAISERYREAAKSCSASSTHGGQPAACASVLAVLDIIERDDLVGHVRRSGAACLAALKAMQARHPVIGHAQGKGYLLGLEFVDPKTGALSVDIATQVANLCMQKGVSCSPVGPTIRVSPMIVTSQAVALRMLDIVEQAIADVEARLA